MLDTADNKILHALQQNSRATVREIAQKIGVPVTTVHNRLKKLKKEGVVKRFTVDLDYERLGKSIAAFVFVNISHSNLVDKQHGIDALKTRLKSFEEVQHIYAVTGNIDLILQVRARSIKELDTFLIRKLRNISGIERTSTVIVLEEE